MSNVDISIIIPSYNSESHIHHMLDSIQSQTFTNWELIIIDDNSTDNTFRIVSQYAEYDSRIKVFLKSFSDLRGANSSRNIGLRMAKGNYVCFFDSDDFISPSCLKNRIDFINNHPNIDFAVFPAIAFKTSPFDDEQNFGYKHYHNVIGMLIRGALPFTVWTNIYKRYSLIDNEIFWDENLKSWQDRDYNLTAINKGLKFSYSNSSPDYFWRIEGNDNSISKKITSSGHLSSRLYFVDKWYQRLNNQYNDAILSLTSEIFRGVLDFSQEEFKQFMSSLFIQSQGYLQYKLNFVYHIIKRCQIGNRYVRLILCGLICPIYTFRPSLYFQKYKYYQKITYKALKDKYLKECIICFDYI